MAIGAKTRIRPAGVVCLGVTFGDKPSVVSAAESSLNTSPCTVLRSGPGARIGRGAPGRLPSTSRCEIEACRARVVGRLWALAGDPSRREQPTRSVLCAVRTTQKSSRQVSGQNEESRTVRRRRVGGRRGRFGDRGLDTEGTSGSDRSRLRRSQDAAEVRGGRRSLHPGEYLVERVKQGTLLPLRPLRDPTRGRVLKRYLWVWFQKSPRLQGRGLFRGGYSGEPKTIFRCLYSGVSSGNIQKYSEIFWKYSGFFWHTSENAGGLACVFRR